MSADGLLVTKMKRQVLEYRSMILRIPCWASRVIADAPSKTMIRKSESRGRIDAYHLTIFLKFERRLCSLW